MAPQVNGLGALDPLRLPGTLWKGQGRMWDVFEGCWGQPGLQGALLPP